MTRARPSARTLTVVILMTVGTYYLFWHRNSHPDWTEAPARAVAQSQPALQGVIPVRKAADFQDRRMADSVPVLSSPSSPAPDTNRYTLIADGEVYPELNAKDRAPVQPGNTFVPASQPRQSRTDAMGTAEVSEVPPLQQLRENDFQPLATVRSFEPMSGSDVIPVSFIETVSNSTYELATARQSELDASRVFPHTEYSRQLALATESATGQAGVPMQAGFEEPRTEPAFDAEVVPAALNTGGPSTSTQGTTDYVLAAQPRIGDHFKAESPSFDCNAAQVPATSDDFSPDALAPWHPYDPCLNQDVYQGKQLNANQRPLLELGRPWYQLGPLSPGNSLLGFHNNVNPQFLIFGDYRQAIASNTVNGDNVSQMAFELNTFWNLFITSTERVVWGIAPLDNGVQNTRWEFDRDRFEFETDFDIDFGYFEGDLGALTGGLAKTSLPFDAPFAIGLTPILIQNGIWLNDAVEGFFYTVPARNSPLFNISNMDITFAYIWDGINSAAFQGDNSAAKAYAIYSFIEALNGYFEIDYAFLEDRTDIDRSYHNIGLAYTRRFGRFLSHTTRVIANAGQQVSTGPQTADGVLLLLENSLITANPYTVIPYFNFFAGFDTPQSVAGNNQLLNTGILFESDGMTGYPTLDTRGASTAGGAVGLNLLAQDFSQQLILEAAAVFRQDGSDLAGDQYGIGMRYQLPLSNSWIFRTDAMYGFFRNDDDDTGMRMELRKKF